MFVSPLVRNLIPKRSLEIIPNVHQLTIAGANIILIAEEELTLVDCGFRGSSAHIMDFLKKLGRSEREVSLIIITHNHYDHAGEVSEVKKLTGARVAAHRADIGDGDSYPSYAGVVRKAMRTPLFSALHPRFIVEAGEVDLPLVGGEVLKPLGGLEVIPTPGHTPGSISLFSARHKLLIVGDAINRRRWLPPKMASTDLAQALDSIKRLARLNFDIICYGHGRPLIRDAHTRMQAFLAKTGD